MARFNINEDGTAECEECLCVTSLEQIADNDYQHWNKCSSLSSDEDMTGANEDR